MATAVHTDGKTCAFCFSLVATGKLFVLRSLSLSVWFFFSSSMQLFRLHKLSACCKDWLVEWKAACCSFGVQRKSQFSKADGGAALCIICLRLRMHSRRMRNCCEATRTQTARIKEPTCACCTGCKCTGNLCLMEQYPIFRHTNEIVEGEGVFPSIFTVVKMRMYAKLTHMASHRWLNAAKFRRANCRWSQVLIFFVFLSYSSRFLAEHTL